MIYKSTSIESLISRIIRNTKITDASAINDMYEWIPEAMEMLQTKYELEAKYEDVDIEFHYGRLPCGLNLIEGVEYQGSRLNVSSSTRNVRSIPQSGGSSPYVYRSVRGEQLNPITGDNFPFLSESIEAIMQLPNSYTGEFYQTNMDAIITSFETGTVRIHYLGVPLDKNGLPLIPDNSNYKESIYYYVRAKLIASGLLVDPILGERECMQRHETYAGRAISEITWPSVDRMNEMVLSQVRLIKPVGYWENFGSIAEEESYG